MLTNIEWREIMEEQRKVFDDNYRIKCFEDVVEWDKAIQELENR